ncbi:Stk1 family PASTA domain-containing Ser/Thr kinase [Microbacterium sp. LRZ72]|uniref:Stk1 family PASTA domain-containing Ser/Thr kinase n=1 Tax=Microbacterium sp. LRZ72 TaxID=2942481 RepID=UPI0029A37C6C|nr:Stk1 family PASTA domain-containing Ser/Thr kinase [Microbacterium sp. LRZ72]MDX2376254.1 Stk1 family PASTA domain-containing Ser/Thr kinase [Microbacterium sp. LRZ72]
MTNEPRVLSSRYRIDDLIGRGGMASVYRGFDQTLGRPVAVKILNRDLADDSAFRTRFRLEAQAASRMAHPTIVRVYDAGEDSETDAAGAVHTVPYIVMELVRGSLLKDVIADGPVPENDAVRYVDGILEALEYSHRAGVVHRDIKPGNIMITPSGGIKVMDFGIARAVSDSSSTVADTTAILGTAAYFSPEQAKGEPVDARADLYSTGVVLFELLTGRTPFRGESPVAVAYQHVSEAPVPPSEVTPSVSRALDAVVLRALAKDPYQRFQTAAEFRETLVEAVDGVAPSKRQVNALTSDLYGPNPRQAAETARSLRQLSSDTTMTRTQSGPPAAWIWTGVAVLAVVIISLFFWIVTIQPGSDVPADSRIVPDISGMSYDAAEVLLIEEDLEPVPVEETNSSVPEGDVIRSVPAAGTSVNVAQEIRVYVSTGAETVQIPPLEGLSTEDARAALDAAGLQVGQISSRSVPGLSEGTVISATPSDGAEVIVGSTVDLVTATGRVALNNYVGFTLERAVEEIEGSNVQLTVETSEDPNCPATDPPTVSQQSIAPGEAPVGSTVVLTSCTGDSP